MTGGGGNSHSVNLRLNRLQNIKIKHKILGINFRTSHRKKQVLAIFNECTFRHLRAYIKEQNITNADIIALARGLSKENQLWLFKLISRLVQSENEREITEISDFEYNELLKIHTEFFPNIIKITDDLYYYDGYFLPVEGFELCVFWNKHELGRLERESLAKIRSKNIIDVGGYIGDSAILLQNYTDKNIYSFEPTSQNFKLMLQTLKLNNATRVMPINAALGASEGSGEIGVGGGASSLAWSWAAQEKESVKITTLDSFVRERNLQVGLIKVDVEGFEMDFLQGAKETICTQKPTLLLSIYHQPSDFFNIKPLIESWNLGYSFKIYKGVDGLILGDVMLICEVLDEK